MGKRKAKNVSDDWSDLGESDAEESNTKGTSFVLGGQIHRIEDEGDSSDLSDDSMDQDAIPMPRNRDEEEEDEGPVGLGASSAMLDGMRTMQFTSAKTMKKIPKQSAKPKVDKDFAAFEQYSKGIGSKLLQKMGYQFGEGLGKKGEGIANPIDVKLRPQKMGLGHGGFDERTDSVKRQKEATKDDKKDTTQKRNAWKKSTVSKPKRLYKTAQELIDEQSLPTTAAPITTKILDMTGKETKILDSISELTMKHIAKEARIAELVHNFRLLVDLSQQDLIRISRQQKMDSIKLDNLKAHIKSVTVTLEADLIKQSRIKSLTEIAQQLISVSRNSFVETPEELFDQFEPYFEKIRTNYLDEYRSLHLDTLFISVINPLFQKMIRHWNPLEEPKFGAASLLRWKDLFSFDQKPVSSQDIELEESPRMSSFEVMLYTTWLPKVRSAVNNEWDPSTPDNLIGLMDAWQISVYSSPSNQILPPWMCQNIIRQLILPKLSKAVVDWRPNLKSICRVHTWLHPWLPIMGDELNSIWSIVRRKFESFFKEMDPMDPLPINTLTSWTEVFPKEDMDHIISTVILPALVRHLRTRLVISPAQQDLSPLVTGVFPWSTILPDHTFSHLIGSEFFPKWHEILCVWISSPGANLSEISQWYQGWKVVFERYEKISSVKEGFRVGLDIMNQGLSLKSGTKVTMSLPKPKQVVEPKALPVTTNTSLAFKDYVEIMASEQDISFVPLNKNHPSSGKPLYKLGSLNVYLDNGVIFIQSLPKGPYEFKSLEESLAIVKRS